MASTSPTSDRSAAVHASAQLPDEAAPQTAARPSGRDQLAFWFWNPGTVIGIISTVISSSLTLHFYEASKIKPLLIFAVHPLKTELQRPGFDKELGFSYGGKPVDSESITSVRMAIWNAGTRSIRDGDVLDPMRLVMPERSAILSARVKKASRPICGFERLDEREDYKSGTCRLKWRILEPGDGAVVEVIYAGGARDDPKLEGTIEGQQDVVVEKYHLNPDGTTISRAEISIARFGLILLPVAISFSLFVIALRIQAQTQASKQLAEANSAAQRQLAELRKIAARSGGPIVWVLMGGVIVCLVALFALLLFFNSSSGPPFGW